MTAAVSHPNPTPQVGDRWSFQDPSKPRLAVLVTRVHLGEVYGTIEIAKKPWHSWASWMREGRRGCVFLEHTDHTSERKRRSALELAAPPRAETTRARPKVVLPRGVRLADVLSAIAEGQRAGRGMEEIARREGLALTVVRGVAERPPPPSGTMATEERHGRQARAEGLRPRAPGARPRRQVVAARRLVTTNRKE